MNAEGPSMRRPGKRSYAHFATLSIWALIILTLCMETKGDLPVHCLGDEFLGSWQLKITMPGPVDLHNDSQVCGHERPDDFKESLDSNDNYDWWWYDRLDADEQSLIAVEQYTMCIPHANGTGAQLCAGADQICSSSNEVCQDINFTLIYDEGFLISASLENVTVKFAGFFKYELRDTNSMFYPDLGLLTAYNSICSDTITGVYSTRGDQVLQNKKYYRGCFVARKDISLLPHSSEMRTRFRTEDANQVVSPTDHDELEELEFISLLQIQEGESNGMRSRMRVRARQADRARASFSEFLDSEVIISDSFVEQINDMNLGWQASSTAASVFTQQSYRTALLRMGVKSPSILAGYEEEFIAMRTGDNLQVQLDSRSQLRSVLEDEVNSLDRARLANSVIENTLEFQVAESAAEIDMDLLSTTCAVKHLPARFDWTDVNVTKCPGIVDAAVDQGSCGSCYAMAATHSATARLRIANHPSEECRNAPQSIPNILNITLSPQSILDCSYVNQGCMGGYPLLAGFHGYAVGWLDTSCDPFMEINQTCNLESNCTRYYAQDFSYADGHYGYNGDMAAIMIDLIANGPVGIAIKAPAELQVYESGVFTPLWNVSSETLRSAHSFWQKTNHAVLLVGYDVLHIDGEKVPVWRIQNSWGETWGDNGFFYLPRGKNLISSESMPTSIRFMDGPASKVGKELLEDYFACINATTTPTESS